MFGQDFDGDFAVQPSVACAIDFAHPAGSGGGDDFVGAQARTSS